MVRAGKQVTSVTKKISKVITKRRSQTGDGAGKFLAYRKELENNNNNDKVKASVVSMCKDAEYLERWENKSEKIKKEFMDVANYNHNSQLLSDGVTQLSKLYRKKKSNISNADMFTYEFFKLVCEKTKNVLRVDEYVPVGASRSFSRAVVSAYGEEMTHPKIENIIKEMGDVDKLKYKTENLSPNHITQTICYVFAHFRGAEKIETNPQSEDTVSAQDFAKWAKIEPGRYMIVQHGDEAWLVAGVQFKPYRAFLVPLQKSNGQAPVGDLQNETFNLKNYSISIDELVTLGGSSVGDFWGFQLYWGDPDDADKITVRSRGLIVVKAKVDKPAVERTAIITRDANLREKISENAQIKAADRKS